MKHLISKILLICCFISLANDDRFAKIDRAGYPFKMQSKTDFDVASKFENLVFLQAIEKVCQYNEAEIKAKCNIKQCNIKSIEAWKSRIQQLVLKNLNQIDVEARAKHIPIEKNSKWDELVKLDLNKNQSEKIVDWLSISRKFYDKYALELLKLAALYPAITSEIEKIDENEVNGNEFEDKRFLLTFDDGPTVENGNTDKTTKILDDYKVNGLFFVLGQSLKTRLDKNGAEPLKKLYKNQRLASHGFTHFGHQKDEGWKESLVETENLIKKIQPDQIVHFRGPYGQRNKALTSDLKTKKAKHFLWNIDSQDWHKSMTPEIIANRQITLMLLWRKGILLFHDIHSKSIQALPIIIDYFNQSGVEWIDARKV